MELIQILAHAEAKIAMNLYLLVAIHTRMVCINNLKAMQLSTSLQETEIKPKCKRHEGN